MHRFYTSVLAATPTMREIPLPSLARIVESVEQLATTVREGPQLSVATEALGSLRLGVLAITIWLGLLAAGCLIGGLVCWSVARRA